MSLDPSARNSLLASLLYPENELSGLSGLARLTGTPAPAPQRNALADLAQRLYPSPTPTAEPFGLARFLAPAPNALYPSILGGALANYVPAPAPAVQPVKRRVFFSFHYQDDINRVNIVRKSWVVRPADKNQPAAFFDHSLWESTKRTGPEALKKLIRTGMQNSSVTCLLAGEQTWSRPWVRYEIAQSIVRGNGLLTVYIDGLQCMRNGFCGRGLNPLDYVGLYWADDARAYICENFGGQWRPYPLYTAAVTWPAYLPNASARNQAQPLSAGAFQYDYKAQNGYANLSGWAQLAADRGGR